MRPPRRPGRRIRARVLSLVGIGMLGPLAVLAWAGWVSLGELQRRVLAEREILARLVAERLAAVLSAEMESLQATALSGFDTTAADVELQRSALRRVYVHRHVLFDEVFLLDRAGAVLVHEPADAGALDGALLVDAAQAAGHPAFTDAIEDRSGRRRLYALVPVRRASGELNAVVGAVIDPRGKHLAALLTMLPLGAGESIDVVDGRGIVVASTSPERLFLESDHAQFMAGLIREKRSASGDCHGCHGATSGEVSDRVREVFAFTPLSIVHWGIAVRQPQGAALAFAGTMSRNVILLGAALFAVSLLFAWGAALSVTRPLATLTDAAERLSEGQLSEPIPELAADEVGRLGAALDRMRVALKQSLEKVERANDELEERVRERTAELERLNRELKDREEARAMALRKVISAQEAERKRIARELHDETSQSLAALAIGLESAAKTLAAGDARRRVEDAVQLSVKTLDEVHRLIFDLRPSVLDDLGLQSAIVWYANHFLKEKGVAVRCEFSGLEGRLAPEIETTLFRTVQEAMTNIARHAQAENVLVQCSRREGRVVMEIEDDGVGFDPATLKQPDAAGRGFGLLGMRERVELLGGSLTIESAPGEGTRVVLSVRLPEVPEVVSG